MEYIGFVILIIVGIILCMGTLFFWRFQKTTKRKFKDYFHFLGQIFAFGFFVIGVTCIVVGIGLFFQK